MKLGSHALPIMTTRSGQGRVRKDFISSLILPDSAFRARRFGPALPKTAQWRSTASHEKAGGRRCSHVSNSPDFLDSWQIIPPLSLS